MELRVLTPSPAGEGGRCARGRALCPHGQVTAGGSLQPREGRAEDLDRGRPHTDSLTVPLISTAPAPLSPYPYQTPSPVLPQGLCGAVPAEPPCPSLLQGLLSDFTQNLAQMSPPLRGCHPHLPRQPLQGRSPSPRLLGLPAAPSRCRETRWAAPTGRRCGTQSRVTGSCQEAAGPSPRSGASAQGGGRLVPGMGPALRDSEQQDDTGGSRQGAGSSAGSLPTGRNHLAGPGPCYVGL